MAKTRRLLLNYPGTVDRAEWNATLEFWGEKQAQGAIDRFDSSVPPPPAAPFILVKGEVDKIEAIRKHDAEFQHLHAMTAQIYLDGSSSDTKTST